MRANYKKQLCEETTEKRQERLEKQRAKNKKQLSQETAEKRQERLEKKIANKNKQLCEETVEKRQQRLAKMRAHATKQSSSQTVKERQEKLIDSPIHEQTHAKNNIDMFHKCNNYNVNQCSVCWEAWPTKVKPRMTNKYQCSRCTNDKERPKRFSKENDMIPSVVSSQLEGLTQVEEMLIARALPIMRVYIKPGGQRGYSGHCIDQSTTECNRTSKFFTKIPKRFISYSCQNER